MKIETKMTRLTSKSQQNQKEFREREGEKTVLNDKEKYRP
jgi:hypothetical protein